MNLTQMISEFLADLKGFSSDPKGFWSNHREAFWPFIGMALLDVAILLVIISAIFARLEWLGVLLFAGLGLLALSAAFGLLVWQAISGEKRYSVLGAVLAGILLLVPAFHVVRGSGAPRIHDISTNLKSPPLFVKIKQIRPASANALDRKRPKNLVQLQRAAYPGVKTLRFGNIHPGKVFEAARDLVFLRGWDIVHADPKRAIIEATESSLLLGFKDDIIIRIRERKARGQIKNLIYVDMRSVSRVGVGDLGVNARRIEDFLADLKKKIRG